MKKLLMVLPLAIAAASSAPKAQAQAVLLNGLGSSALFLESGLGTTAGPINAQCWWTGNNSATIGNVVTATDTKDGTPGVNDTGNAWVAWTTGTSGTCSAPASDAKVYAYLQTDSVVGDRCLFNAHPVSGSATCSIKYPASTTPTASAGLLFPANDSTKVETSLPITIAAALTASTVNYAGTDIRPEDAVFAVTRAATTCGAATGSTQYRGLGYVPASPTATLNSVMSAFSSSVFHTTQFTLPGTYFVTPIGATAVVVAVNGNSTGLGPINDISSANLAQFLDGRNSWSGQANGTGASGQPVTVLIREPLSGTYNTMEYNVPNRTTADASGFPFQTSQDNGSNQPSAQQVCGSAVASTSNPMNVMTPSGAFRKRAIGTGQELAEVLDTTNNGGNILGYGFWSAANFKPFAASTTTHYLTVDGIDPLRSSSVLGNPIPTSATDLATVTMSHVQDGTYPIWSLLRFVTADSTSELRAENLASATKNFGIIGTTPSAHPDFIISDNMTVVRSHFIPPAGATQPTTAMNGTVGDPGSSCSANEAGGDVGGVVINLIDDDTFCANSGNVNGQTGQRR